jgi:hypothetical protein
MKNVTDELFGHTPPVHCSDIVRLPLLYSSLGVTLGEESGKTFSAWNQQ